jgi:hypothetical protein
VAKLEVNVDHVATVRQARLINEPDPVTAAALAELAGADGISCTSGGPAHIQDRDLMLLRQTVKTRLNLEMAATPEMLEIATEVKPDLVTLVPEKGEGLTTSSLKWREFAFLRCVKAQGAGWGEPLCGPDPQSHNQRPGPGRWSCGAYAGQSKQGPEIVR